MDSKLGDTLCEIMGELAAFFPLFLCLVLTFFCWWFGFHHNFSESESSSRPYVVRMDAFQFETGCHTK